MQRVQQTFQLSNIPVTLTSDPNAPAAHTLSLVSNTTAQLLPSAIGMTYVGGNGFSFIDQQAPAANSIDQLEWIAAHNISHELMLAFGVKENYDQTGQYLDARNALWSMMTNPSATFSPDADQGPQHGPRPGLERPRADSGGAGPRRPAPSPSPPPSPSGPSAPWPFAIHRRVRSRRVTPPLGFTGGLGPSIDFPAPGVDS